MTINPNIYEIPPREIEIYAALLLIEKYDPEAVKKIEALREKAYNNYFDHRKPKAFKRVLRSSFEFWLDPVGNFMDMRQIFQRLSLKNNTSQTFFSDELKDIGLSALEMGLKEHFSSPKNVKSFIVAHPISHAHILIHPFIQKKRLKPVGVRP